MPCKTQYLLPGSVDELPGTMHVFHYTTSTYRTRNNSKNSVCKTIYQYLVPDTWYLYRLYVQLFSINS